MEKRVEIENGGYERCGREIVSFFDQGVKFAQHTHLALPLRAAQQQFCLLSGVEAGVLGGGVDRIV